MTRGVPARQVPEVRTNLLTLSSRTFSSSLCVVRLWSWVVGQTCGLRTVTNSCPRFAEGFVLIVGRLQPVGNTSVLFATMRPL